MTLNDIDFNTLTEYPAFGNSPKPSVYCDDQYYYKIIHNVSKYARTSLSYYLLNGLDFIWAGMDRMSVDRVGLITKTSCPAFKEFIYDGNVCCGYITHRGTKLDASEPNIQYIKFVKHLVDISVKVGYGYVSVNKDNIVMYNGQCSFIDLDFCPIRLRDITRLTSEEMVIWENEFRSDDGLYLHMLKNMLL